MVNVTSLRLSNNVVSDISAIKNLNELTDVHIDGNKVKDFTVLFFGATIQLITRCAPNKIKFSQGKEVYICIYLRTI